MLPWALCPMNQRLMASRGYWNMNLEQTIQVATSRLHSGALDNEAQVKQAVILPILRALDWDDTDPESFRPEYSVHRGSVDYALLDRGKPMVFIEAKRIGGLDAGGEEQLFGYASNRGVPLLVLTDGNRWDFYLSMAEGVPSERRFYRLELQLEHKLSEYMDFFKQHLRRGRVISGEARQAAEQRHASNRERERARQAIPSAWLALLTEPEEMLRDLLAERVESECGTKPEFDDVEAFLKNLTRSNQGQPQPGPPQGPVVRPPLIPPRSQQGSTPKIVGFVLGKERIEVGSAIGTLASLLTTFADGDPQFMERFAKRTVSKTRRLVARNRSELYEKTHLIDRHSKKLENGWWIGTNLSKKQVRVHIETACAEAGVRFGSQLKLIER